MACARFGEGSALTEVADCACAKLLVDLVHGMLHRRHLHQTAGGGAGAMATLSRPRGAWRHTTNERRLVQALERHHWQVCGLASSLLGFAVLVQLEGQSSAMQSLLPGPKSRAHAAHSA